ncbi:hypothetical protein [Fontivita pretiosa]|uniref:hypothetical protein n=1 Tax=Fontivita pretiosa TaxID=2989684 RepID=UPI003D17777E
MKNPSPPHRSSGPSRRRFVGGAAASAASAAVAAIVGSGQSRAQPVQPQPTDTTHPQLPTVFAYGYDVEPYPLDPGPHLFLDWRYVLPGRTRYFAPSGEGTNSSAEGLHGRVTTDQIKVLGDQSPYGVRLEAQPASKLGPVIPNDKPWEYSLCYPTLGYFDGKYRMWYEVITPRERGAADILCYAESSDGVTWHKPELGLVEFDGNTRNNIVYDEKLAGRSFHGVGVCYDPSAPPQQRYKMIYNSQVSAEEVAQLKAQSPASITPLGQAKRLLIFCAASPDGLRWTPLPQPLMAQMSDTGTTLYYDQVLRRYVGYFRMSFMNRRVIGRSEGPSLDVPWPAPQAVLWTDPGEPPSNDYYTNGKSLYPGTKTAHLMFPTIYQRFSDSSVVRMVTSLDGQMWMLPPGDCDVLKQGPEGSWDGGCVFAGNGLAEIAGDRVALPYIGYALPHKFPRLVRCGEVGLATWPKHRLCALVADEEGEFYTQPFRVNGETLRLNFHARRNGFVKVEVVGKPGRSLDDCDDLFGDRLGATVTWRGQSSIGAGTGGSVTLRFRLRSAKLFSFEFV